MEEDQATPPAMAARASARSASFDVELGEARGGFEELRISEEEEEEGREEQTPAPSTPPPPPQRQRPLLPPAPPFVSFFQREPAPMERKKEEPESRYGGSASSPFLSTPPRRPESLSLKLSGFDEDPPFEQLDCSKEGSTTFSHLPRDLQLRIFALVPEGGRGGGGWKSSDAAASAIASSASSASSSSSSSTSMRAAAEAATAAAANSKRSAALSCRLFRDLLLDGEAWPCVELNPVTARSAAWLARRAGGGGGSFSCLEEGNTKAKASSSSSSSSSSSASSFSASALSLSSSSSGIREVTLRPSTEQQAVLFNDIFLATSPGIASLTIDTPWHATSLTNFAFVFWALKFQRSLRSLKVKVQEVDFDALPPNLESLAVECARFSPSSFSSSSLEEENEGEIGEGEGEGEGEEEEVEDEETAATTAAEAAAAAAALPSLEGNNDANDDNDNDDDDRRHREDRSGLKGIARLTKLRNLELAVWSHGGAPWQDMSPLLSLTKLRSLSLNTHPFESRGGASSSASNSAASVNDFTWSRLGSTMPDLRVLSLSAAPGFDAALPSLPSYCDLRFFTRGAFRETLARSYAANLVSLELKDLSSPRFDARVLSPCRRLSSLDVSFAADAGVVEGLEAVAASLRSLKTGCPALRLVLPCLPQLEELEAVAFHDLDLNVDRVACASLCGGKLRSVYLAALDFGVGMHVFVHEAGKRGLDLRFATRPLRAVFTPDQLPAMDLDGNGVEVVG